MQPNLFLEEIEKQFMHKYKYVRTFYAKKNISPTSGEMF